MSIVYIGANDHELDLFEGQYPIKNGVAYNSYLIKDEQNVVMDTIDANKTEEWLANLETALEGSKPDYVVVQHMEPDHAASLQSLIEKYPEIKVVGNAKIFTMIGQFFPNLDLSTCNQVVVKDGDELNVGSHTLHFVFTPMVHWPEVMMVYEDSEKALFSADAFGKFGALDVKEEWIPEARRYFINIVGKYGSQVQATLKKAAALEIETIYPLHGPVLSEDLGKYIDLYDKWSSYTPEESGVLVAYASIYGNTAAAARKVAAALEAKGNTVECLDLARCDEAEAVAQAFRFDRMVLAASSYDAGVFPPMENFLHHIARKNYQKRTVALIENGTWAPSAVRTMKALLEGMKEITLVEPTVTIKSALNAESEAALEELVKAIG